MCDHLYGNTNNFITVTLKDDTNLSYDIGLSPEDKKRAETDVDFFKKLLNHCKMHYQPNRNVEIFENTEDHAKDNAEKSVWNYDSISALITTVDSLSDELNDPRKRKKVWQHVANILSSQNFDFDSDVCSRKWRNLMRTYKICKDNISKTGRGPIRFEYFKMMDEILGKQPNITSPHSINISSLRVDKPAEPETSKNQDENATPTNIVNPLVEITNSPTTPTNDNLEIVGTPLSGNKNKRKNANIEYFKVKKLYFESKKEEWEEKKEYKKMKDDKVLELMNKKLMLEERKVKALEDLVLLKNLEIQNRNMS